MRAVLLFVLLLPASVSAQQVPDPDFDSTVARPAYAKDGPTLAIDEAHANFHTMGERYRPFADLMRADGYRVVANTKPFDRKALAGIDVLVIANAGVPATDDAQVLPAFTVAECDAVHDWVRRGGALLLIADHAPFGEAAERLGLRFGVGMGKGFAMDVVNSGESPTTLVFSRDNGLLGSHPVLDGRDASEKIGRVVTFTGQSLVVPDGGTALLRLGPDAREPPTREALVALAGNPAAAPPAPGRAQGIALKVDRGRVVVLGEAAMMSAQVFPGDGGTVQRMGMNVPGNDDRQFALNVVRWLSGALD